MNSKLYQDYDALAYKPHNLGEERGAFNHIKKAKQKTKGLEIVFDPKSHKDFVTGFRKRKQQRRKEANSQLEKKAKKQRVESRAERRKEMKHKLNLPDDYGIEDSDTEQGGDVVDAQAAAAAANAEVKQYQQPGYTTTVCITNFNAGYDDSDEEPAAASEDEHADVPEHQQQQQQKQRPRHKGSNVGKSGQVSKISGSKHGHKKQHGKKKR